MMMLMHWNFLSNCFRIFSCCCCGGKAQQMLSIYINAPLYVFYLLVAGCRYYIKWQSPTTPHTSPANFPARSLTWNGFCTVQLHLFFIYLFIPYIYVEVGERIAENRKNQTEKGIGVRTRMFVSYVYIGDELIIMRCWWAKYYQDKKLRCVGDVENILECLYAMYFAEIWRFKIW